MFSGFMDRRVLSVLLCLARADRAFNLAADDPANSVAERFIRAQLVAHLAPPSSASATLLYFRLPVTSRPSQSGASKFAQLFRSSNSTSATTRPSCRPR